MWIHVIAFERVWFNVSPLEDYLRKAGNAGIYFILPIYKLQCIPNIIGVKCKSNYNQTSCDAYDLFCDMFNQNSKQ